MTLAELAVTVALLGALTIDVAKIGEVGWVVLVAVVPTVAGKVGTGLFTGRLGGFTAREGLNAAEE